MLFAGNVQGLTVYNDQDRLQRVLVNLIQNGIKFTEKGFIVISVEIDPINDDLLLISVKDTGVGIEKENIDKIF